MAEKLRYYPALRIDTIAQIHEISNRASDIKCGERFSVYFIV